MTRDKGYPAATTTIRGFNLQGAHVGFFAWLEATALADWVRMSSLGYPLMITCHAVGMAIMVGIALALDLRLVGKFAGIPYGSLQRFLGIAWLGFLINTLSGSALFAAQAVMYSTDWVFLTKIALVFAGAITIAILQTNIARDSSQWPADRPPSNVKAIAIVSIVFWLGAIVMGRLTAYL